jgi:hypothetical protein
MIILVAAFLQGATVLFTPAELLDKFRGRQGTFFLLEMSAQPNHLRRQQPAGMKKIDVAEC